MRGSPSSQPLSSQRPSVFWHWISCLLGQRRRVGEEAHKLVGNLDTFGHPTGSEHARGLEHEFLSEEPLTVADADALRSEIDAVQIAIQEISVVMKEANSSAPAATDVSERTLF